MPNMPNNWKTDLTPFVGKSFDYKLRTKLKQNELISLFKEITTDSAYYDLRASGDFPELPDYDGSLNTINPKRGFSKQFAPEECLGAYYIHYKQWKNDMSGEVKKAGSQLADSATVRISNDVLRLFARAWNSSYTGSDGKTWAATDHPNGSKGTTAGARTYEADTDTGTFSNSFDKQLTAAGIDYMRNAALRFVTPSGNPYQSNYTLILVSPELRAQAQKILGMNAELKPKKDPDSAENAASSIHDMRFMVCGAGASGAGLGFTGNQFALVDPEMFKETSAIVYNTKPEVQPGVSVNPYIKPFIAYCSFDVGFADARPILFSNY